MEQRRISNASDTTLQDGGRQGLSTQESVEFIPTRGSKVTPPKPAANPLQFIKVGPCDLYKTAVEQIKKVEEVKKIKAEVRDEAEDWQSNLDNWKCGRRKRQEHIIERVVEVKKLELEEHDRNRRRSKTFNEMMEERNTRGRKASLMVYNDDEANDLSDLGIGTSSGDDNQSLSDRDERHNNGNLGDISDSDERNHGNPKEEYTYDSAIQGYVTFTETRVKARNNLNETPPQLPFKPRKESSPKIEEKIAFLDERRRSSTELNNADKIKLAKVDVLKRRELFEKAEDEVKSPNKVNVNNSKSIKERLSHLEKHGENESKNPNRAAGEISGTIKDRLTCLERQTSTEKLNKDVILRKRLSNGDVTKPQSVKERLSYIERQGSMDDIKDKSTAKVPVEVSIKERVSNLDSSVNKDVLKLTPDRDPSFRAKLANFQQDETTETVYKTVAGSERSSSPEDEIYATKRTQFHRSLDSLDVEDDLGNGAFERVQSLEDIDCIGRRHYPPSASSTEMLVFSSQSGDTDREDSGIHTADVSSSVSQADEPVEDVELISFDETIVHRRQISELSEQMSPLPPIQEMEMFETTTVFLHVDDNQEKSQSDDVSQTSVIGVGNENVKPVHGRRLPLVVVDIDINDAPLPLVSTNPEPKEVTPVPVNSSDPFAQELTKESINSSGTAPTKIERITDKKLDMPQLSEVIPIAIENVTVEIEKVLPVSSTSHTTPEIISTLVSDSMVESIKKTSSTINTDIEIPSTSNVKKVILIDKETFPGETMSELNTIITKSTVIDETSINGVDDKSNDLVEEVFNSDIGEIIVDTSSISVLDLDTPVTNPGVVGDILLPSQIPETMPDEVVSSSSPVESPVLTVTPPTPEVITEPNISPISHPNEPKIIGVSLKEKPQGTSSKKAKNIPDDSHTVTVSGKLRLEYDMDSFSKDKPVSSKSIVPPQQPTKDKVLPIIISYNPKHKSVKSYVKDKLTSLKVLISPEASHKDVVVVGNALGDGAVMSKSEKRRTVFELCEKVDFTSDDRSLPPTPYYDVEGSTKGDKCKEPLEAVIAASRLDTMLLATRETVVLATKQEEQQQTRDEPDTEEVVATSKDVLQDMCNKMTEEPLLMDMTTYEEELTEEDIVKLANEILPLNLSSDVEIVSDGISFPLGPTSSAEPPKEKPPPPPTDLSDEETVKPKSALRRVDSTKRIKKEIRRKRSDFLGIEGMTDDSYLEPVLTLAPDMTAFLIEEQRQQKQLYRQSICSESDSNPGESRDSGVELERGQADEHWKQVLTPDMSAQHSRQESEIYGNASSMTSEEDEITKKEREIIEMLEKEEQWRYANNSSEDDLGEKLAEKLRELEQEKLRLEWQRTEEENRRLAEESLRREETMRLRAKEQDLRQQETNHSQPINPAAHNGVGNNLGEVIRVERERLQREQEELVSQRENLILRETQQLHHTMKQWDITSSMSLQDISRSQDHFNGVPPVVPPAPANYRLSLPDLQEQANQGQRVSSHRAPPPIPPAKPLRGQGETNATVHLRQNSNPQQMTRQTLQALSAAPRSRIVSTDNWIQAKKKPESQRNSTGNQSNNYNYQHWLIQEAEHRRITEQQQRNPSPRKTTQIQPRDKPLPDAIIQTLTQRVQNRAAGQNSPTRAVRVSPNHSPMMNGNHNQNHGPIMNVANPNGHFNTGPTHAQINGPMVHNGPMNGQLSMSPLNHNGQMSNNVSINHNGQINHGQMSNGAINSHSMNHNGQMNSQNSPVNYNGQMSTSPMNGGSRPVSGAMNVPMSVQTTNLDSQEKMLSVSGKKKCSHCTEELGRGAAMIIESLRLFYHIDCFKCCVCHVQLGDGLMGTDVRVRNNKLHCHNCYSSDDGVKFSCV